MREWPQFLAGVIPVIGGLLVAAGGAGAQTVDLEWKRLEPVDRTKIALPAEHLYRMARPQNFLMRTGNEKATSASAANFWKVITKEPAKYRSDHPFRGVAKLGSSQYGFVIDTEDAKSHEYNRLYFDLNHNGDLTDDKVVEGKGPDAKVPAGYRWYQFPRVELSVDCEGTKTDYAFFLTVSSAGLNYVGGAYSSAGPYPTASLQAAGYREGRIELGGKTRRVVLIDFNSNGRFDDRIKINQTFLGVIPTYGDILLLDPEPESEEYRRNFDLTENQVAKLVAIDGELYDLEISPGGDKLTLAPTATKVGYVTLPSDGFRAAVFSDEATLKISGDKSERVPLPPGEWKLISYAIDLTGRSDPGKAKAEAEKKSLLVVLSDALVGGTGFGAGSSALRTTRLSARAGDDSKPFKVTAGETAALPFGPPFAPVVTTSRPLEAGQTASLGLTLVGSGGEICSGLTVDGNRPAAPEFTISTPDGEEVDRGDFEYG